MDTLAPVIPFPPHPAPHPSSVAIATVTLSLGHGPEKVAELVGDFGKADELFEEIVTSMASQSGFASLEAYLTWTGCAAIWAASGPS